MIKKEDMEKIASLPTQELIAFAIAQVQLNESLERENQCLKKTMEHREVINRNLIDMQRQLDKSHVDWIFVQEKRYDKVGHYRGRFQTNM